MTEAQYLAIIKKQQEIINMLISGGAGDSIPNLSEFSQNEISQDAAPNNDLFTSYDPQAFRDYLHNQGLSQNTVDNYDQTMRLFFRTYGELNIDNLKKWEIYLQENMKVLTIQLKESGMKRYFAYSGFSGYTFRRMREQKKAYTDNIINEEQYNQLVEYTKAHNDMVSYKIILVIARTGVRVSELIKLKTADLAKGYSDIVSKENKQRRIYYPESLVEELKSLCPDEYIITGIHHKPLSTRGISERLKDLADKAEVPRHVVFPHSFRHYFAKTFIKNGGDLSLLGDLLGHSNLSTTALYTRKTVAEQMQAVNEIVKW